MKEVSPASSVIEVRHPLRADVADGLHDVGKAADRDAPRCGVLGSGGRPNSQSSIGR
jgi:hypothetical protein